MEERIIKDINNLLTQLFQKMKEAGYEWDVEYKQLKKIEQDPICSEGNLPEFESYLCLMFQKFRTKGMCTNGEIIDYVKEHSQKLKDALCHHWSEEDNDCLNAAINNLEYLKDNYTYHEMGLEPAINWLESLKDRIQPQPQWKPSIAQLNALSIVSKGNAPDDIEAIVSLYQDLKKLREE